MDMEAMFKLLDEKSYQPKYPIDQHLPALKPTSTDTTSTSIPHRSVEGCRSITFNNVHFGYPNRSDDILRGLSFHVDVGQTVAIVGSSGSGKSTVLRLLFKFFEAKEGEVLIDGVDIGRVDNDEVRSNIAVVPQDVVLFNGTLEYNLKYGNPNANASDLHRALESSSLLKQVESWETGMNTLVGERGLKLSGGEKQRVAIARGKRSILLYVCLLVLVTVAPNDKSYMFFFSLSCALYIEISYLNNLILVSFLYTLV